MPENKVGCARPTGAVVGGSNPAENVPEEKTVNKKEIQMVQVKVGGKAPDFEAPAYYRGGFTTVKLSDYLGKWVVLCFYPGDFTFV